MTIRLSITEDVSNHILLTKPGPCWHCNKPTLWVELSFETPLHPGRCSEAKWGEYIQACRARRVVDLDDPIGGKTA